MALVTTPELLYRNPLYSGEHVHVLVVGEHKHVVKHVQPFLSFMLEEKIASNFMNNINDSVPCCQKDTVPKTRQGRQMSEGENVLRVVRLSEARYSCADNAHYLSWVALARGGGRRAAR